MLHKTLFFRLNALDIKLNSPESDLIVKFLSRYYKKVILYKPKLSAVDQFFPKGSLVINLDKNVDIKGSIRADVSRVYDLNGEYLRHNVESAISLNSNHITIYDNDIIHGVGIAKLKEELCKAYPSAYLHFKVVSFVKDILMVDASQPCYEFLDLNDFIDSGLCVAVDKDSKSFRVPYTMNEKIFSKTTGLSEDLYLDFKKEFEQLLKDIKDISKKENLLNERVDAMHKWAQKNNRKHFVIGISGGIDSAVSLALLKRMVDKYPEENYCIRPVIAPIFYSEGTTGQSDAAHLARQLCSHLDLNYTQITLNTLSQSVGTTLNICSNKYLKQQADYWLRPLVFHNLASEYDTSCMVGTVNYSEWMLGWFSQYLDVFNMMPIVDLYKSEVYELARLLEIPDAIIEQPPLGGLANGETDEEALGFTYEEFEFKHKANSLTNDMQKRITESEYKRERFNKDYVFSIKHLM